MTVQANLRGGLRAFCVTIGGVKIERQTALTGKEPKDLKHKEAAFLRAARMADEMENNLAAARTPEDVRKFSAQWEELERKADFAALVFAIPDDPSVAEIYKMLENTQYRH